MTIIIDGKDISAKICEKLKEDISTLCLKPGLAVILVGGDPASQTYVKMKENKAKEIGILSKVVLMPETSTQKELEKEIKTLNNDKQIDGILVQLPLPKHLNENEATNLIDASKDVDGLHPLNVGKLMLGQEPLFYPCTPSGCMKLIDSLNFEVSGKNAVVIGRSNIVGKPIAQLLMKRNATVTVCHSRTANIGQVIKNADIIIAALGKPKFVKADMVKKGAVVIDVGTTRTETGLVGDVDFEAVKDIAYAITPVPKGVGPMTIAMLMSNCVDSAKRRALGK